MTGPAPDLRAVFTAPDPYDLDETLRFARCGPGDPTTRRGPGWFAKAWRSPEGAVTLRLDRLGPSEVRAVAWGAGSAWALARVPALLGLHDDVGPARFADGPLARLARRFAGVRLPRVPWPLDKVVSFILQQRVAFDDAVTSWRRLVYRHGEAAPGDDVLKALPPAADLLRLGDHDWRTLDVDRQRQAAIRDALRYAHRINETADMDLAAARQRVGALRGVGPWTLNMVMGFGFGDPDAVPTGDYHLPHDVCWGLAGEERGDDARMLALLEPYAGERFRVIRWLYAAQVSAPRRGPRMAMRERPT